MVALLDRPSYKIAVLLLSVAFLAVCMTASVMFGAKAYGLSTLQSAFSAFDGSDAHLIIRTSRVPRAAIAAVVGAALAVAGALMQALTRNPLASPSLFGVNAGAGLALVVAVALFGFPGLGQSVWIAFAGAALSAAAVYALGSGGRAGPAPVNMTLAGAAIAAFASSLTSGVLLGSDKALDQVLFWLVGSVAGRELAMLTAVLPYIAVGFVAAFALASPLNVLAMGEDVAVSLGQRTAAVKLVAAAAVVVLAGGAVAVAGPIGFIGIVIPHIARHLVGRDHHWLLPYCAVLGAILLVAADLGSRFLLMPSEVPVGVLTAIIGVPFFVLIARRGRYAE
ncbi:iron ABC transporter [Gordoniibacillus kamchatkensis]|uniref:Iron ABC transporter n=1 Tax=Gordoniibacillus kamchatkensis TaxID=1590651 RepID=A0ABR5AA19_9BACL|nr:iron ABC transporter permease [Paenibacillus sp. VKM B-2647]KIL37849.1 iron ABC transporter [Paenibacillus sp. VKM B-2647]